LIRSRQTFTILAGTRIFQLPAMLRSLNSLFILLLLSFLLISANKVDKKLSKLIDKKNQQAFDLKDSNPEKAKLINKQAFKLLKNGAVDPITKSDVYSVAGNIYSQNGNYDEALGNFLISLNIRKQTSNTQKIADMMLNVANTYNKSKKYYYAISYYNQSLNKRRKLNESKLNLIPIYNGLTQVYEAEKVNKRDSAFYCYNRCLKIINQLPEEERIHNYISDLYSNLGQYYESDHNYQEAMFYYNKTVDLQLELDDQYGLSWTYHHIGIVFDELHDYQKAKSFYHKAEQLAIEQSNVETLRDISESWMHLYSHERNMDSISFYYRQFKKLNEEFNELETAKNVQEVSTRYQVKEERIKRKNANERSEIYFWGSIIISLTFLLILFFLIRNYRQKQRIALLQVDVKNNEINELLNQQEAASYEAMLEGQDQERLRIARELHDRLGSTLATIKLGLQNEAIPQVQQQVVLVNTAISEVRTIAHDLSGGNIEQYGLAAALNELKNTLDRSGKITMSLFMETVNIQASLHVTIYRIVQELVSNTLKHAEATEITLQLTCVDEQLTVIYEDNGKGFDLTLYQPGMGITNIRHRIEKWQGTIEIDAQPNRGTIVILTVPITMQHD